MKVKRGKILLVALGLCCTLIFGMPVQASEENVGDYGEITPMYVNIKSVAPIITISGGKAACTGKISVTSGKSCSIAITLQKKSGGSWINVKKWGAVTGTTSCSVSGSYSVSKGSTYRVKAVGKCGTESHTQYSSTKSY